MKNLITYTLTILLTSGCSAEKADGNSREAYAVLEVGKGDYIQLVDVPIKKFNMRLKEGEAIDFTMAYGKFEGNFTKNSARCYQFVENNKGIQWELSETEIGFIPDDEEYVLIYSDNGTVESDIFCDCINADVCKKHKRNDDIPLLVLPSGGKNENISVIVDRIEDGIAGNNILESVGKFENSFKDVDGKTYYQFKSDDNNVWWALDELEIGFRPAENKSYTLVYSDNGTTAENKPCNCPAEYECECEVYDDVFYRVYETEGNGDIIDLATVVGFDATDKGILLHTADGSGFYIEK